MSRRRPPRHPAEGSTLPGNHKLYKVGIAATTGTERDTGLDTAERRPLHQLNWRGMLAPGTLVEFWLGMADLGYLELQKPEKKNGRSSPYGLLLWGRWKSESHKFKTKDILKNLNT